MSISLWIVLFDALFQLFTGADFIRGIKVFYSDMQTRVTGPFNFYGLLSAELIALFPIILGRLFYSSQKKISLHFLYWISFSVFTLYILYKAHSRGAWIAASVSLVAFAILDRKKWFMIGLVAAMLLAPFVFPKSALIHLDAEHKEQSLVERYELWHRAIQVIKKRPLFGCGINTYARNYQKFDERKNWRVPSYYAHNGYLQFAAETGLISLAMLLIIFGIALKSGFEAFRLSLGEPKYLILGFLCGFIALLIQVTFDTTLHNLQSAVLIWLFAGILIALKNVVKNYGNQ
jgi:O-antigen ligase